MRAVVISLLLVACASGGGEAAVGTDDLTGVTQYNDDPAGIVLWSQNVAQFGHDVDGKSPTIAVNGARWKNIIRCVRDSQCNRFGVLPDVFAFQEASREMCELIDNELETQLNGGGNAWDWHAVDNWSSFSFHWKSGCILYRRARFDSSSRVIKNIGFYETNNPAPCKLAGHSTPGLKLKDVRSGRWISIASFHEDHFGDHDTCDNTTFKADGSVVAYDETKFCNYLNMQKLGAELPAADVQIVAGDQNYTPFNCDAQSYARCHWKSIVAGQGSCSDKPNLGWHDPFFEKDPNLVKGAGAIDWIVLKGGSGVELMPSTERNYKAGMVGKCIYCAGDANVYGDGNGGIDPDRISDHTAKFVKILY
jgi:hypothetical protein